MNTAIGLLTGAYYAYQYLAPPEPVQDLIRMGDLMSRLEARGVNEGDLRTVILHHSGPGNGPVKVRAQTSSAKVDLDHAYGEAYFFPEDEAQTFFTWLRDTIPATVNKFVEDPAFRGMLMTILSQAGVIAGTLMNLLNGLKPEQVNGLLYCVQMLVTTLKTAVPSLTVAEKFLPVLEYGVRALHGAKPVNPEEAVRMMMSLKLGAPGSVTLPMRSIDSGSQARTLSRSNTALPSRPVTLVRSNSTAVSSRPPPTRAYTTTTATATPTAHTRQSRRPPTEASRPSVPPSRTQSVRASRDRPHSVAYSSAPPSSLHTARDDITEVNQFDSVSQAGTPEGRSRRKELAERKRREARRSQRSSAVTTEAQSGPSSRRRRRHSDTAEKRPSAIRAFLQKHKLIPSKSSSSSTVSRGRSTTPRER